MSDNQELMLNIAKLKAQNAALTHLVAILATRMAMQYDDPDNFVMTLTAPLEGMAEGFDPKDLLGAAASGAVMELHDKVENLALSFLNDE